MREPQTKTKRSAVSKRRRFEVFKRDGFCCQYCGATAQSSMLHCDHIDPVSNGGGNEMDNLITACDSCNMGKSDVLLSSVPKSLASRAAEVAEREQQIAGYQAILKARRDRIEATAQAIVDLLCLSFGREGIPMRHFTSIKMFVEKLGEDAATEASEIACSKFLSGYDRAFRYFCGVCWKKIRDGEGVE